MKLPRFGLLTRLLWAAILLAGCRGPAKPVAPTPTPARAGTPAPLPTPTPDLSLRGTLTVWHSFGGGELPGLVQVIADFQQRYPNVLFDVLSIPEGELLERYTQAARQDGGPALLFGPAEWGPALFDAGLVLDLKPRLDQAVVDSLSPPARAAVQYQNAMIGLPYAVQGVVLYRNIYIVSEMPEKFEELVTLAKAASHDEVVGADLERGFLYSGAHLAGLGGQLMRPDGMPAFNNAQGLAWVGLLQAFVQAGPTEFLSNRDLERFQNSESGLLIGGTWDMEAITATLGADAVAIDPWPAYQSGHLSGFVMANNLYLNSRTPGQDQEAALKFMADFLSPAAQGRLASPSFIPAIQNLKTSQPLINQAMAALAGGTPYPLDAETAKIYTAELDVALRSIFTLHADPSKALQAAEENITSALQGTPTPGPK